METLFLTLDTVAFMVLLYFSYKGEAEPGQPELGPFRIRAPKRTRPEPAPGPARGLGGRPLPAPPSPKRLVRPR